MILNSVLKSSAVMSLTLSSMSHLASDGARFQIASSGLSFPGLIFACLNLLMGA